MDSDTLAPHHYAKDLLTEDDLEHAWLPTMTSGDKQFSSTLRFCVMEKKDLKHLRTA